MIGIYFSGTGNTRYCIEAFVHACDEEAKCHSIESTELDELLETDDTIVFAYPIYYSNLPKIVNDFLIAHRDQFRGKKVFIITTMGLFSGDGCGCSARLLRSWGAEVTGGLQVKMPDCISDEKALKKPLLKNKEIVKQANLKVQKAARQYLTGTPPQEGLSFFAHLLGLFGQRLWFYRKTQHYSDKLQIDQTACSGCGLCAVNCPMNNITIKNGTAIAAQRCTMCYRCVNTCPRQAITLLGKQVHEQSRIEKYV